MTENLSTCKSPQQMFGALFKTYYAEKMGWDPKDIVFVSAIPCTAKKFEVGRAGQSAAGVPDVDYAITTRELGRMIKAAGIDFRNIAEEPFDDPFNVSSGAGVIFGATGGVMEAALRTAAEIILQKPLEKLDFPEVRGTEGIKLASYKLGDATVNVAVTSGTGNAKKLLRAVQSGQGGLHRGHGLSGRLRKRRRTALSAGFRAEQCGPAGTAGRGPLQGRRSA